MPRDSEPTVPFRIYLLIGTAFVLFMVADSLDHGTLHNALLALMN